MTFQGAKYQPHRDVVDIARDLRRDITTARASGELVLPAHARVSVTCQRYSGGQRISAVIKGLTPGEARDERLPRNRSALRTQAEAKLRELMDAYNYNNSDPMADYYDVLFAGHVTTAAGVIPDHLARAETDWPICQKGTD